VADLVVRARRRYFGKVMLTVTDDGLDHPVCGFIPWSSIRSLPAVSGSYGRRLQIDVFEQGEYVGRIESRLGRLLGRINLRAGQPLLDFPQRAIGMTPEALRAEIETRAGRTWPH
jgi:hypothetical protein